MLSYESAVDAAGEGVWFWDLVAAKAARWHQSGAAIKSGGWWVFFFSLRVGLAQ